MGQKALLKRADVGLQKQKGAERPWAEIEVEACESSHFCYTQ